MANTKDFGRFFLHVVDLIPGAPLVHTSWSQAIEPPFYTARVAIFRIPFTLKGLVVGWWQDSGFTEEEALMVAMEAEGLDLYDVDLEDDDVRAAIREKISENTETLDEEWEVLNAFGLTE